MQLLKYHFFILFFIFCSNISVKAQKSKYEKHGTIFVEKFTIDTPFQCTNYNEIYTHGKIFTFKYQYFNKSGEEFLFKKDYNMKWRFIPKADKNDSAVCAFEMYIVSDLEDMSLAVTHQSVIQYRHLDKNKTTRAYRWDEKTGLIENKKNIWLHPPRTYLFKILELNPFPYIKFPCKKGKSWRWKLEIGADWGDARWKIWNRVITNKYKYKIIDTECYLETSLGRLKCCKVESQAKSSIGKTFLTSYFNEQYGFVRYEYVNIDNSMIIMELINVIEKK